MPRIPRSPHWFAAAPTAPRRFALRLVAGALLLNLIVCSIAVLNAAQSRARHEADAVTAAKNMAVLLERDLSSVLDKIDLTLLSVADEVERREEAERARATAQATATAAVTIDAADPLSIDAFIDRQSARLPEVHGLRTTDALGNVNHGFGLIKGVRANLASRAYFRQLAASPAAGLVISEPVVSRVSGQWEIVLARRLERRDHSFDGVVYATIRLQYFNDKFAMLDVGQHGVVSLRRTDLALIARLPNLGPGASKVGDRVVSAQFRDEMRSGRTSHSYRAVSASDGVERSFAYRYIGNHPMVLVVGLATDDYLAQWRSEIAGSALLVAAFVGCSILVSVLAWRGWRRREAYLQTIELQHRKFRTLFESSPDALVISDSRRLIAIVNRQAESLFECAPGALIGQPVEALVPARARSGFLLRLAALVSDTPDADASSDRDGWAVTRSGRQFPASIRLTPIDTEEGGRVSITIRDLSERRASESRIDYLAHHDTLTGLPNRLVAKGWIDRAIAQAGANGSRLALVLVDLDNFKHVNDSFGQPTGDAVLEAVADRLRECARESDLVWRHGGDEFVIALTRLADADAARAVVERLFERFEPPCMAGGQPVSVMFSLGIAVHPEDGADGDTLLKNADIAMHQAKHAGRNTFRFFNQQMNTVASEHLQLLTGLRLAIERNEFVLHYQPQIDLASGCVIGAEALVRWLHPELGLVPPARFIPVAEESGLIVPIGEWVLREACRQAVIWQHVAAPGFTMAVNLSAVQFGRGNVEWLVEDALATSGLAPGCLELELTESILIDNVESVLATVKRLQQLGVKLALDDFGTGYSSLSYLKRFAFDKLKIDQSFVRHLATDPENVSIVRAIVQMARGLGLTTIAEGVEDEAALECLLKLRCDEAQGYLFSRPMPAAQFDDYLRTAARRSHPGVWSTAHGRLALGALEIELEEDALGW